MNNCVFCFIANNPDKEKDRIISLDDDFVVMLTLNPETPGHLLVFPKKHYDKIDVIPELDKLFEFVTKVAKKAVEKLNAPAYTIKMNNQLYLLEKDKQHVGHIHFHIIPRYRANEIKTVPPKKASMKELSFIKTKLSK